jgi:hypothetical protein
VIEAEALLVKNKTVFAVSSGCTGTRQPIDVEFFQGVINLCLLYAFSHAAWGEMKKCGLRHHEAMHMAITEHVVAIGGPPALLMNISILNRVPA